MSRPPTLTLQSRLRWSSHESKTPSSQGYSVDSLGRTPVTVTRIVAWSLTVEHLARANQVRLHRTNRHQHPRQPPCVQGAWQAPTAIFTAPLRRRASPAGAGRSRVAQSVTRGPGTRCRHPACPLPPGVPRHLARQDQPVGRRAGGSAAARWRRSHCPVAWGYRGGCGGGPRVSGGYARAHGGDVNGGREPIRVAPEYHGLLPPRLVLEPWGAFVRGCASFSMLRTCTQIEAIPIQCWITSTLFVSKSHPDVSAKFQFLRVRLH